MVSKWTERVDMRAFFAAHPDFTNMFKKCEILDADGNPDSQC